MNATDFDRKLYRVTTTGKPLKGGDLFGTLVGKGRVKPRANSVKKLPVQGAFMPKLGYFE